MRTWIEQQRYLADFTLASMARRKVKNLGVLTLYTLIVFLLASVMLFTQALRREAAATLSGAPDVIVQRMVAGRHDLFPAGDIAKLANLRGVQKVEGRLWGYHYDSASKANYTVTVPPSASGETVAVGQVALGQGIAARLALTSGKYIALTDYSGQLLLFRVAKLLAPESELLTADLMLMAEPDFRALLGCPAGYFTDVTLTVANPQEVHTVAGKVAGRIPGSRVILREEILRTYESIFNWREGIVLVLLSGAVLAFAILAFEKASGLSAEEKREIGVLKAIGWETGDVIKMKFWEGALISITGFLVGYAAASAHVFRFAAALFRPVLVGWSVMYPDFELVPTLDGLELATLFFFTVLPYTLATIVPIWRAAVTDPDAVMRGTL